ncbi:MAG: ribonuclease Z [Thermoplasmata archaeon]
MSAPFWSNVKLVVLGSGGSWPSRERNTVAVALKLDGEVLLFDCAEGTQRQFMLSSLSFMQVQRILLSHLHGDHFLGLPGLVETMALNDRREGLHIYGPPGTSERLRRLFSSGYFSASFPIALSDMKGGDTVDCGRYRITAAEASHNVPSLAYAVEEKERPGRFDLEKARALGIPEGKIYHRLQSGETVVWRGKRFTPDMVLGPPRRGRKIVYTGDTSPCRAVEELARGADVLLHDATSDDSLAEKANRYGHSSAAQAAETARKAGAGTLILLHISPRYRQEDWPRLLEEARRVFPSTILASDLMELEVPLPE